MTFGQLFIQTYPDIKIVENGTCVWLYFDGVNHYTFKADWWNTEIEVLTELLKEQEAKRQIVQCKDCKHGCLWNGTDTVYCNKNIGTIESSVHKPDWFCADGEWKRNGNDVTS